jgi:CRISPR-associated protein Cas6
MQSEPKVDLCFQLLGKTLLVDHGYALYSAVSHASPHVHKHEKVGLKLIRGRYIGNGMLDISPHSELVLRLLVSQVPHYLQLAGKILEVLGEKLTVGVPKTKALIPASALYSPLVTTRNCQDQHRFEMEISNQMQSLGIRGEFIVGKRRTFAIHGKQLVGYSLEVTDLNPQDSIILQEEGLGGRRKMGCGFFEPSNDEK